MRTSLSTTSDRTTKLLLAAIVVLLIAIAVRPYIEPQPVWAEARFDHVTILATGFLRNGRPGALLLDRRNGNVWHLPMSSDRGPGLGEPQFIVRVPFEKLDQAPAGQ